MRPETTYEKADTGTFWFPLDNAAKIYPSNLTKEVTTVFRLSVVLVQAVKIQAFYRALTQIEQRFPYFKVQLKRGFFWYFLEHIPLRIPVEVDDKRPCRKFPKGKLLVRILIAGKKISVEFSHILTDGTGAFEFMKTLLIYYSRELGADLPSGFDYYRPGDPVSEEEFEDSYNRYFKQEIPPMVKRSKAFHLPFSLKPKPRFGVRNYIVPLHALKALAAEKGVTINDYLVAIYLFALQEIHEELGTLSRFKKQKNIRIQVPINLRRVFPSKTMRNFSLFVMPEIDLRLGHFTFDEILKTVFHQIRLETDEKLINKNISRNVRSEKKLFIKSIPLILKNFILKLKYYSLGASQYSGVITNLGKATLPPETEHLIDHFVFTPPPPNKLLKINCGAIGFKDKLVLSFGRVARSKILEEKFIGFLKDHKISVQPEAASKA